MSTQSLKFPKNSKIYTIVKYCVPILSICTDDNKSYKYCVICTPLLLSKPEFLLALRNLLYNNDIVR